MAGRQPAGRDLAQIRAFGPASGGGEAAARMEGAARRRVEGISFSREIYAVFRRKGVVRPKVMALLRENE